MNAPSAVTIGTRFDRVLRAFEKTNLLGVLRRTQTMPEDLTVPIQVCQVDGARCREPVVKESGGVRRPSDIRERKILL